MKKKWFLSKGFIILLLTMLYCGCPLSTNDSSSKKQGGTSGEDNEFAPDRLLMGSGSVFYVAVNGSPQGDGSAVKPFSLQYAFDGADGKIKPGDLVWIKEGYYWGAFEVNVNGTKEKPVIFRAQRNKRVTLDCGKMEYMVGKYSLLNIFGKYVYVCGLELMSSFPGRFYGDGEKNYRRQESISVGRDAVKNGDGSKAINCIAHDQDGVGLWKANKDFEFYGNLTYNHGHHTPDGSGRAHNIYTQNHKEGYKKIIDNIFLRSYGNNAQTLQIYSGSENAPIDNYLVKGNVFAEQRLYVGGHLPASGIVFEENMNYRAQAQLGARANDNSDIIIKSNYFADQVYIDSFRDITVLNNTFTADYNFRYHAGSDWTSLSSDNNTFYGIAVYKGVPDTILTKYIFQDWQALGYDANSRYFEKTERKNKVFVRPNKYETNRAHIIIYNWQKESQVTVDITSVTGLKAGKSYIVRNGFDYYAEPVVKGVYRGGGQITIPMKKYTRVRPVGNGIPESMIPEHPGPEFGIFVLEGIY